MRGDAERALHRLKDKGESLMLRFHMIFEQIKNGRHSRVQAAAFDLP
jgi:hypothetical protein